jgi:hypothetical protein
VEGFEVGVAVAEVTAEGGGGDETKSGLADAACEEGERGWGGKGKEVRKRDKKKVSCKAEVSRRLDSVPLSSSPLCATAHVPLSTFGGRDDLPLPPHLSNESPPLPR